MIPAAGLGTRLLPATKEQPKEMLPVFVKSGGRLVVKPLLQLVFEHLYDAGIREFCFITGKAKRAIEDHFTPDYDFLEELEKRNKQDYVEELSAFYRRLEDSIIVWVNQPKPRGFGDAVLRARSFARDEDFIVYAGDSFVLSNDNHYIKRLLEVHESYKPAATMLVKEVEDPRIYGVVEGDFVEDDLIRLRSVVEKPQEPPTNIASIAVYAFKPLIFDALTRVGYGRDGEKQLTDAIQLLLNWGFEVYALMLGSHEKYIDVGNPESYWEALHQF